MTLRVAVVRFPGSNCDFDTLHCAERAGTDAFFVWHRDTTLQGAEVVLLPGGVSYGDYLRSGAIARFSPIMPAVQSHAAAGGPVLGICNGFQILCEAGLLPGALMRNARLSFVSRPVWMPVAHGEGRFAASAETLRQLEAEKRIVVRYVAPGGGPAVGDDNPNGSLNDIAGICNAEGNVVGLMPHPDRAADAALGNTDGAGFFRSMLQRAGSPAGGR
jgi:phosphoribosylformylglycinamidine (FGAM) synthase-like amidotransferase family enzyme